MFFKLKVSGEKAGLTSYIIVKNPNNTFERNVKTRGKIFSKFDKYTDNEVIYSGYIENDSLQFIKLCRQENLTNYLNSEEYSVCPFNLSLIDTVFRSALRENCKDGISEEDYNTIYDIEFTLGPFSLYDNSFLIKLFEECGYNVKEIRENLTYALEISGKNKISTFIQQVYVISYCLTNHLRHRVLSLEGVDKFTNLSKGWIENHPHRNMIINKLSKIKRNIRQFETNLISETETDQNKVKEKVDEVIENLRTKLSELRYNKIISLIDQDEASVLDLGCASGNLIERLLRRKKKLSKVIGFDLNKRSVDIAYNRGRRVLKEINNKTTKFKTILGNIRYPDFEQFEDIDIVVLSEIIEHFEEKDLFSILNVVFKGICPEKIILTTPNKDYNKTFGMPDDQLRHPNHKFEFTTEKVKLFAEDILSKYGYTYSFEKLSDDNESPFDQLSFIILFKKNQETEKDSKMILNSKYIYYPFDLDINGYRVTSKHIRAGSCLSNWKIDYNWIVSLAPTMSPANCSQINGYLEHPSEILNYFHDRRIYNVIWETKYMGSRGTIVATRSPEISKRLFDSEETIKIYSRNGYNFFKEQSVINEIYGEIKQYLDFRKSDVIAIDCEILPWSYKANVMIEKEFQKPVDCAILDKRFTGRDITNEELFLKSLNNYNKHTDIEVYPFNIIVEGNIHKTRRRLVNVKNGYYIRHGLQLFALNDLCNKSKYFKNVNYGVLQIGPSYVNGNTLKFNIDKLTEIWEDINNRGLEGIVVKPNYPTMFLEGGVYVQPSLKCRTRDYLRIIYGINYLEDDNLKFLKERKSAAKRKMAIQQYELTQKILFSFINGSYKNRLRLIFGFFGMEGISHVDATL